MDAVLEFEIMGSKFWRILALFGIILVAFLIGKIARYLFKKSGDKFETEERFVAATTLHSIGKSAVFLSVSFGITISLAVLELQSKKIADLADTVGAILLTIGVGYFVYWLSDVPSVWFTKMAKGTESKLDDMMAPVLRKSLRVSVVILVLVQIAQILSDRPITSIIAGLGIGGLAIALAAQDSIKNFFGSIVLFVDKPFEIGDRVVIDGHDSTVEIVGFRSTKIRTLDGHLVTVPNGELANKTIQNIGKRPYIKRVANITITYDTRPEKIDRALEILKEILNSHEGMHADLPPRIFFDEFNPDSLNIVVFYWYHPPDYWKYMAFSERFNKEVFRRFNEEGIEFAFPTQTLYVAGDKSRPLTIGVKNNRDKEIYD